MALRRASPTRTAIPRIVLAVTLTLTLLSGIIPLNALSSSSSHECSMSCCLDRSPHATGSCGVEFAADEEAANAEESAPGPTSHHAHAGHISQTHEGHKRAKQSTVHPSSDGKATAQSAGLRAQALAKPCALECAAAAASTSTQNRRPRDAAAQAIASRPRPAIIISYANHPTNLWSPCAASHKLLPPRAPPRLLANLSA